MSVFETEPAGAPHELVRWTHRDALQTRLLAKAGNRRFAYAAGMDVLAVPLPSAALQEGIDALFYRDHDEAYLGSVYVDDLGATCGSIGYKVLVGGVARSLHGGLNRPFEWWVSNRSKKLSGISAVADQLTAVRINTRTYHEETDMKTTRKPTPRAERTQYRRKQRTPVVHRRVPGASRRGGLFPGRTTRLLARLRDGGLAGGRGASAGPVGERLTPRGDFVPREHGPRGHAP